MQTIAFSVVHYTVSAQILQIIRILKIWTWAVLSSNCSPELQHLNCIYASIDFVTQKWVKFSIYTLSLTSKRYYTTVNTSEPQLYHSLPEHGSTDNYDGSCWTDSSRSQIQCLLIFSCFFWIIQTDLEATETSRQRAKLPMRELQIMWNEWWNSGSWNERLMWCMFKGGARVPRPLGVLNEPLLPFFFFTRDECAVTSLAKITKTYFHIHVAYGHVRERNGSLSSIGGNRTTFILMFKGKKLDWNLQSINRWNTFF